MHHRRHSLHPWNLLFLISALLGTGVGRAAMLLAEPREVAPGEYVTAYLEQARVSAGVTWRTGPQLRLADSDAGSARFQAIQPGRALISATVDGELVSTFVVVAEPIPGTLPPRAEAPVPSGVAAPAAEGQAWNSNLARAPHLRALLPQDAFA